MRKIIILISILAMAISCSTNGITGLNKQNGKFENGSNSSEDSNSSGNQGGTGDNNSSTSKNKLKITVANSSYKIKTPQNTDIYLLFTGLDQFTKPNDILFDIDGEDSNQLIAMSAQNSLKLKVVDIEGVSKELCKNNKKVKELLKRGGSYSGQVVDLVGKKFSSDVFKIDIQRDSYTGKMSVKMTPDDKLAKELKQYVINSKNTGVIKVTMESTTDKIKKEPGILEIFIVVSSI